MTRFLPVAAQDAMLDEIASATAMHICSGRPTSYLAVGTYSLGSVVMEPGDFTKSSTSTARRLTVAEKAVSAALDGEMTHVALIRDSDDTLLFVTTTVAADVVTLAPVVTQAWVIEIPDTPSWSG